VMATNFYDKPGYRLENTSAGKVMTAGWAAP
jgi:hypothetical protein